MADRDEVLVLAYSGCSTCKKAIAWLEAKGVKYKLRPIVAQPPTAAELKAWLPKSGLPVKKWLNTSGQSYRALGKAKIDAASDADLARWLTEDGKLVKRPVLIVTKATKASVLVGFRLEQYEGAFD